jgi:hypothetical protein
MLPYHCYDENDLEGLITENDALLKGVLTLAERLLTAAQKDALCLLYDHGAIPLNKHTWEALEKLNVVETYIHTFPKGYQAKRVRLTLVGLCVAHDLVENRKGG